MVVVHVGCQNVNFILVEYSKLLNIGSVKSKAKASNEMRFSKYRTQFWLVWQNRPNTIVTIE